MMNRIIKSPETRRYIYVVLTAVSALLVGYGVLTLSESGLWLTVAGAVLGFGNVLSASNTPEKPATEEEVEITTLFDTE